MAVKNSPSIPGTEITRFWFDEAAIIDKELENLVRFDIRPGHINYADPKDCKPIIPKSRLQRFRNWLGYKLINLGQDIMGDDAPYLE